MTEYQEETIRQKREEGVSYEKIANFLGLDRDTVRNFCRKNGLDGVRSTKTLAKNCCRQCGMPIVQTPRRARRVFCSSACRNAWWNKHSHIYKKSRHKLMVVVCPQCGKSFYAYPSEERKFCSIRCSTDARLGRHRTDDMTAKEPLDE